MTTTDRPSREIDGKGRSVRELLAGRKYSIDYYQREYKAIDYSTMPYAMFLVMRDIRGKTAGEIAGWLRDRFDADTAPPFAGTDRFRLHGMNRRQIKRMLARMTDYVETRSGMASRFEEYMQGGKKGYEVEHVWADHPERHRDEFAHPSEFQEYRNRIGGSLLLPKSFNASYGDLAYAKKREHYVGQNLLAKSLHELAYDHNPAFKRFIAESGLEFWPHPQFKKADVEARQELYQQLAERIWGPERLTWEAES